MPCKAEITSCGTEMRSKAALQDATNGYEQSVDEMKTEKMP